MALVVLPAAVGLGIGLYGCGGSSEPAKGPEPTKVVWSRGEGNDAPAPENAPAASSEDTQVGPKEIDLDALPPKGSKPAKPAAKETTAAVKEPESPKAESPKGEPPPAPAPSAAAEETEEAAEEPAAAPAAPMPLGKEMRAAVKTDEKAPPAKKSAKKAEPAPPAETAASSYTGPNPCKTTHFSVPRVEAACANNGRSGAKTVMKEAVGKALAAGATLKCADCHADLSSYSLKKDAVAQLKKWLGP
jgi:hypothetical protein